MKTASYNDSKDSLSLHRHGHRLSLRRGGSYARFAAVGGAGQHGQDFPRRRHRSRAGLGAAAPSVRHRRCGFRRGPQRLLRGRAVLIEVRGLLVGQSRAQRLAGDLGAENVISGRFRPAWIFSTRSAPGPPTESAGRSHGRGPVCLGRLRSSRFDAAREKSEHLDALGALRAAVADPQFVDGVLADGNGPGRILHVQDQIGHRFDSRNRRGRGSQIVFGRISLDLVRPRMPRVHFIGKTCSRADPACPRSTGACRWRPARRRRCPRDTSCRRQRDRKVDVPGRGVARIADPEGRARRADVLHLRPFDVDLHGARRTRTFSANSARMPPSPRASTWISRSPACRAVSSTSMTSLRRRPARRSSAWPARFRPFRSGSA